MLAMNPTNKPIVLGVDLTPVGGVIAHELAKNNTNYILIKLRSNGNEFSLQKPKTKPNPVSTRRRIDVEFWSKSRRDVDRRIFDVVSTWNCRRRIDVDN
jgi:hypothetical protein